MKNTIICAVLTALFLLLVHSIASAAEPFVSFEGTRTSCEMLSNRHAVECDRDYGYQLGGEIGVDQGAYQLSLFSGLYEAPLHGRNKGSENRTADGQEIVMVPIMVGVAVTPTLYGSIKGLVGLRAGGCFVRAFGDNDFAACGSARAGLKWRNFTVGYQVFGIDKTSHKSYDTRHWFHGPFVAIEAGF